MDVAISGASGLIGSALSASLRADGHRVLRLTRRRHRRRRDRLGSRRRSHRRAGARRGRRGRAPRGRGHRRAAVDRRAEAPDPRQSRARHRGARGRGREPGAQAACSCRARRSVTTATVATRSSPRTSGPGTDFLAEVCVAWEAETHPPTEAGVRTVLTRTGIVLDAHGGALKQMLLPFKLGVGGRQGSGSSG